MKNIFSKFLALSLISTFSVGVLADEIADKNESTFDGKHKLMYVSCRGDKGASVTAIRGFGMSLTYSYFEKGSKIQGGEGKMSTAENSDMIFIAGDNISMMVGKKSRLGYLTIEDSVQKTKMTLNLRKCHFASEVLK